MSAGEGTEELRLVLVRHAQAEGAHPRGDHERTLTEQGRADALELGRWLAAQGLAPAQVLVSTATRAQQTLAAMQQGLDGGTPTPELVWSERRLYDGGIDGVVSAVREAPDAARTLWVVAHEPVMSTATWELSDPARRPEHLSQLLARGLPTATAAVLGMDQVWGALDLGGSALVALHTARAH